MPIPPIPFTVECTQCHWHKTVAPRSDVVFPGEVPYACPRCGHHLEHKPASFLAAQMALLKRNLLL